MMGKATAKLKACPFGCKEPPAVVKSGAHWFVSCVQRPHMVQVVGQARAGAVAQWNKRATPAATKRRVRTVRQGQ